MIEILHFVQNGMHFIFRDKYCMKISMTKYFLRLLPAMFMVFLLPAILRAQIDISVTSQNNVYMIKATFVTAASTAAARKVLSDYENIPKFVSSVSSSKIIEKKDGYIVVKQEGKDGIFLFSKCIHLLLRIKEEENRISFEDTLKKDFTIYNGSWDTVEVESGTLITYSLAAKPDFFLPGIIARESFKQKGKNFCREILSEIDRQTRNTD